MRTRWHRLRSGVAAMTGRAVGAVSERLRGRGGVLRAGVRRVWADRRGVTLAALVGVVAVDCPLCEPAVAATISGIASATLTLVGRLLRPLYPVLPLLASARVA